MLPVPMTGFIASLLLNQHMWMTDDLASTTPRAFIYPIFLAFLYYLSRSSLLPSLGAIANIELCYPSYALVAAGILVLRRYAGKIAVCACRAIELITYFALQVWE